ncbi:estradiol 17-beta-dehydrogenase 11-like [Orbicella faveolata]|uniref:estradiol 17-beta-dehydrogenase 11-like n=1 Tax=Orbicella faveolata TaxID=48498 RepID=UPI0009E2D95A|nr:estradiol 17-beta-dehydrogenase 11-like [Orbicella faveolata]
MWLIFEIFVVLFKIFICYIEAVFRTVVRPSKKNIEGQTVLITGAGGGIGRQLALEFAAHGAKLVLWDINKDSNEETAAQVRAHGKVAHTFDCDCSSREDVYRVAAKVQREVGDVDVLVNNAGILIGKKLMNLKDVEIERTMRINTLAHFWTVRSFLPNMLEKNKGHIVNITSLAGIFPVSNLTDYCASKFGATGFSHSLALELYEMGKTGVRVTCVEPYTTNTGLVWHPKARFPSLYPTLEPEYVAKETVAGILRDQPVVMIPRHSAVNFALNAIMPAKAALVLYDFLQVGVGEHVPADEKKSD